jgi:hypothetical protein
MPTDSLNITTIEQLLISNRTDFITRQTISHRRDNPLQVLGCGHKSQFAFSIALSSPNTSPIMAPVHKVAVIQMHPKVDPTTYVTLNCYTAAETTPFSPCN